MVARKAHNLEVVGSSPSSAPKSSARRYASGFLCFSINRKRAHTGSSPSSATKQTRDFQAVENPLCFYVPYNFPYNDDKVQ